MNIHEFRIRVSLIPGSIKGYAIDNHEIRHSYLTSPHRLIGKVGKYLGGVNAAADSGQYLVNILPVLNHALGPSQLNSGRHNRYGKMK